MDTQDSRPVPDPTILTTEQLLREITGLRELLTSQMEERFASIRVHLALIESQRVEQKADTRAAVDAALAAAKEAVAAQTVSSEKSITKSETATGQQLAQLNATVATAVAGLVSQLGDLKERVGTIEAAKRGGHDAYSGLYALIGAAVAVVGAVVALRVAIR